jgi:hypothetical protein
LLLILANALLTPLVGYAVWFGLRQQRPAMARQALWWTFPVSAALGLVWLAVVVGAL